MNRHLAILAAIALLILVPACKKDKYTLNYNHNLHVVENEIDCSTCHAPAQAGAMQQPDHAACSDCHEIDEDNPSAECLLCHRVKSADEIEVRRPVEPQTEEIVFSHERHKYMNASCEDCHTRAAASTESKEDVLPRKEACLTCHDDVTAPQKDCGTCHVETSPVSVTHKFDWEIHHGIESKISTSNCLTCHSEDSCIECHQDKKPRDHNNAWRRVNHGGEAAWNQGRCMVCHEEDYCDRCHSNTKPRSHRSSAWTSGPTVHCSQCHILTGMVGCSVCHQEADHVTADDSPHPPFVGFACEACHPTSIGIFPPHTDPGIDCTVCHER